MIKVANRARDKTITNPPAIIKIFLKGEELLSGADVGVGVSVTEVPRTAEGEDDSFCVPVGVSFEVGLGVTFAAVLVGVGPLVDVGILVGVGGLVGAGVSVGVGMGVLVGMEVGVGVGVSVGVGVGAKIKLQTLLQSLQVPVESLALTLQYHVPSGRFNGEYDVSTVLFSLFIEVEGKVWSSSIWT